MDNKGKKGGIFKILLPIGIFIIVVMIAFGGSKKNSANVIKASADSYSVFIPDNSYMISTFYNPQLYVGWLNSGSYTTLLFAPVVYITPTEYKISFGNNLYTISTTAVSVGSYTWSSQGRNPAVVNGTDIGFECAVRANSFTPSELYSKLTNSEVSFSKVGFGNVCTNSQFSYGANGFYYDIYVKDAEGVEYNAIYIACERNESVPSSVSNLIVYSTDVNLPFSYTVSFNGNSLGSVAYDEGYRVGHTVGYTEGYNVGANDEYSFLNLFTAVLDAPLTTFKSLLNFNLLGINILSFATSIITAVILIKVLKLILGG